MRFKDWIGLLVSILVFFIIGSIIIAVFGGPDETSGETSLWAVLIGLAIMFGGPWMILRDMKSDSTCGSCGKKWSLERDGYRDGEVTELHERDSAGDLKLVHKWDRYQDWKCKNCGHETTHLVKITKTV